MQGTITKRTILAHPILIAHLFGLRVLIRGLLGHNKTFLDLVR